MKLPEDFLLKISKLGEKTDEIIPRVLEAGGQIVEEKVKSPIIELSLFKEKIFTASSIILL